MRPVSRCSLVVLAVCVLGAALAFVGVAVVAAAAPAQPPAPSEAAARPESAARGAGTRTLWRRWAPQRELYQGLVLAKGPGGEVYAAGTAKSQNPGSSDAFVYLAKYSAGGVLAWSHTWKPADAGAGVVDVVVDRAGSLYACCVEWAGGGRPTTAVLKYTSRGRLAWAREYEPGGIDTSPAAMALDSDGDAYVAGIMGINLGMDLFVARFATDDGALRWDWVRSVTGSYFPNDISVTRAGTSFVAGGEWEEGGSTAFLTRVSPSGEMKWMAKRTDPAGWSSSWESVVPARGGLYLAGAAGVAGGDLAAGRYTTDGGKVWHRSWSSTGVRDDRGTDVAVGPDGSVYVAGSVEVVQHSVAGALVKWGPTGGRKWARSGIGARVPGICEYGLIAGTGDLYVSGGKSVFRYTTAGRSAWRWDMPAGEHPNVSDVCLAGSTTMYAAGAVDARGLVVKLRR